MKKNEPLNWMEIEQKIGEIMAKEKFPYCNVSVKARQEIMYVLLKKLVPFIKQHIKSACEFYSRYENLNGMKELIVDVDNGDVIISKKERAQLSNFYNDYVKFSEKEMYDSLSVLENEYNKWLFELAFKDVFKEEENESKM